MKKVTLAIAMAALVLFAGCKKDKETTGTTLKASIEQQQSDGSKTSLDPSDGAIKWTAGDKILVNNGMTNGTFTLVGNGGSTNGTFSYNGEYEFGESNVAVYPHTATISGNTITFDLPAEQDLTAPGSFADDANPMMSTFSDPNSLSFTSLCGGLGLQLTGNNLAITAIEIVSNTTTDKLNGLFEADCTAANPVLTPATGNSGTNSVRLNCTTTLTTTAQSFFIVLPVGTLADGFTMNVYGDGADPIFSKTKSGGDLVVMLNTIKTMNSLEVVPSTPGNIVDLSTLDGNYEAQNGDVLTGNLNGNDPNRRFKISIADGATVTLNNVTINYGSMSDESDFAGITCPGDATIVLEGSNTVKPAFYWWPCIYIAEGKTLTIRGEGSLDATTSYPCAGIGGGYDHHPCGNIVIEGGNINAVSNSSAAGIGAGSSSSHCGNITITGGTITVKGGGGSAHIGGCPGGNCGNITITGGTINALNAGSAVVGIGSGTGSCGDISISGGDIMVTGQAAGIGCGTSGSCGDISISGGDIMATGDCVGIGYGVSIGWASNISITGGSVIASGTNTDYGCGIGIGAYGTLGTITIEGTSTLVIVTKGSSAHNSIGRGNAAETTCGTITIGGTVFPDGISASPYTYPEP